eukprot:CAMPEP_0203761330 /NCGR_PEP_ID=MMETSP0098-20131031/14444_1 /ASSEMBLY_ACC=CAM_ASM_000208 /TAXON_ID=96639 /ORGANISM=" , Strain NY0313808BC1" /LENGTH=850 /DNA_ID=CAMNT_0050655279 /DNA_START=1383 /DNA_END=3935 /DNA_ORIENTATION=+
MRSRRGSLTSLRGEMSVPYSGTPYAGFNSANNKRAAKVEEEGDGGLVKGLMFGLINGGVLIPSMVGFTSIIYKDPFFTDDKHNYLPLGIKLVFLSSAIHQLCFLLFSNLKFAIGQVQDAGLIFLSTMAVIIVDNMEHTDDPSKVMTTTVVSLAVCTAVLGLLLVVIGKLKLARLVQYLPLPVVGGYLAYIGFFCGLSGMRLTTGQTVGKATDLVNVMNVDSLILMLPALFSTATLVAIRKKCTNPYLFPLCLILMPVIFFSILEISGISMQEARDDGWVCKETPTPAVADVLHLFDLNKVVWSAAFPDILPTFFAMFAVVAFGATLDVAAIQFELGKPLDYDSELTTVGYSNIISGCLGGYTGSYNFSKTIFALRNGVRSKWNGIVVCVVEFAVFFAPIDLLSMLPRFLFGSVLLFVAVDLMFEWLYLSFFSLPKSEFSILWLTFIFINIWGLQRGMILGFVFSALLFIYNYSSTSNVTLIQNPRSLAVRSKADRRVLETEGGARVVALSLSGYFFFGTVISTIIKVQKHVIVEQDESPSVETQEPGEAVDELRLAFLDNAVSGGDVDQEEANQLTPPARSKKLCHLHESESGPTACKNVEKTQYVVLDMSRASGIDATCARACFFTILQNLNRHNIQLVFAGLTPKIEQTLRANDVLSPEPESDSNEENNSVASTPGELELEFESASMSGSDTITEEKLYAIHFPSIEHALEWCEEELLALTDQTESALDHHTFFDTEKLQMIKERYFEKVHVNPGDVLFTRGDKANKVYVLEAGRIDRKDTSRGYSDGSLVGLDDFCVDGSYHYTAVADRHCKLSVLPIETFEKMKQENPALAMYLYQAFFKAAVVSN